MALHFVATGTTDQLSKCSCCGLRMTENQSRKYAKMLGIWSVYTQSPADNNFHIYFKFTCSQIGLMHLKQRYKYWEKKAPTSHYYPTVYYLPSVMRCSGSKKECLDFSPDSGFIIAWYRCATFCPFSLTSTLPQASTLAFEFITHKTIRILCSYLAHYFFKPYVVT